MTPISRRSALKTLASISLASIASANAVQPFNRPGKPRLRLSLAAYSFRDFFKANHPKHIDLFQFIDYCADQNLDGAELTSYYFPPDADDGYLLRLKRHAFIRGVELSGTAVGNTFTQPKGAKRDKEIAHVKKWIHHSALVGMPHIRVFAGNAEGQSFEVAKANCIEALNECCQLAAEKGVFLGIENHGGIVAEPDALLDIVRSVDSPWVGINLDTGNFNTDDPYRDLERCAPYAVNVQVKSEITPRNQSKKAADLPRLIKILKSANYQGYVVLEYEAAEDTHTAVPKLLSELRALL